VSAPGRGAVGRGSEPDRSVVPPPGPLRPFEFPPIERFQLDNGLPVLFSRTEGPPIATFSLIVPAGGIREPEGKMGLATLTGALLESGTGEMDAAEVAERLEGLGVRLNVGTSWEVSHVDFTSLADRTPHVAEIASALVREPTFPDAEVDRLRRQQLAGILQRRADPRSLANEVVTRFVYSQVSPFSRPLSGTAESVKGIAGEETRAFHQRTYVPAGAALVAAGNLTAEAVRRIAQSSFGDWSGAPPPRPEVPAGPASDTVQVVIVERPGAVQSEIRVGHVGVARRTPDYFPILVMNTILGGAFSSRLNLNLREKHGFTYGASSSFVMRRQEGPFLVSTAVQTEVTGAAIREIFREIEGIQEGEATPAELTDARQYVAGTFPLRLQTTDGVASRLAELFIYDLPDSYLADFSERVLAVTGEEVLQAARAHLHPQRAVVLVVGDSERLVPQIAELGLPDPRIVTTEEFG
jgi:zinc protease